ncbi:MAG: hypothetical protein P4N59_19045 [Negativicutes bacterium]|nr:hypothetical protein [Negativicutes bacterium]
MEYIIITLMAISATTFIIYILANKVFGVFLRLKSLILCAACALFISVVLPRIVVSFAGLAGTVGFLAVFAVIFAYFVAYYDDTGELQPAPDAASEPAFQAKETLAPIVSLPITAEQQEVSYPVSAEITTADMPQVHLEDKMFAIEPEEELASRQEITLLLEQEPFTDTYLDIQLDSTPEPEITIDSSEPIPDPTQQIESPFTISSATTEEPVLLLTAGDDDTASLASEEPLVVDELQQDAIEMDTIDPFNSYPSPEAMTDLEASLLADQAPDVDSSYDSLSEIHPLIISEPTPEISQSAPDLAVLPELLSANPEIPDEPESITEPEFVPMTAMLSEADSDEFTVVTSTPDDLSTENGPSFDTAESIAASNMAIAATSENLLQNQEEISIPISTDLNPASDSLDDLLDFAFTQKENHNYVLALDTFRKGLKLYQDSEAAPFIAIEIASLLKGKGAYDEAIMLLTESRSLSGLRQNVVLDQEFITTIAYLRIVKNTLLHKRMGYIPFQNIPAEIAQEIDGEFREWRNLA